MIKNICFTVLLAVNVCFSILAYHYANKAYWRANTIRYVGFDTLKLVHEVHESCRPKKISYKDWLQDGLYDKIDEKSYFPERNPEEIDYGMYLE